CRSGPPDGGTAGRGPQETRRPLLAQFGGRRTFAGSRAVPLSPGPENAVLHLAELAFTTGGGRVCRDGSEARRQSLRRAGADASQLVLCGFGRRPRRGIDGRMGGT